MRDLQFRSYKSIAKQLNDRIFTDYFFRLSLIARSIFKWENLPNGIDEKWIENFLFNDGCCVFFKDKQKGFMVARMNIAGNVNYYEEPRYVRPFAIGWTGKPLENEVECVVIRNNDLSIPTRPSIDLYSMKLTDIDRTISVNIHAMKMPIIIKGSNRQMLTLKNLIQQRADNEPVIFGDKSLDTTPIEVLKTDAPIVFDKLEHQKHMVWNECMTMLGINNANMDKKERLVDDEVQANNEQVIASFDVMLKARERAVSRINEVFGTNIKVSRRVDGDVLKHIQDEVNDKLPEDKKVGDE